MSNPLIRLISSKRATIILLIVYVILMASATFIEKYHGTSVAKSLIYYSPLFILLHAAMIVNFVSITIKDKLVSGKKWPYMTLHLALIVMLGGAMVTHCFGKEGMMHIREGESSNIIVLKNGAGQEMMELPFSLELTDFRLTRYPGSQSPSSYESYIRVHDEENTFTKKIYMNNVLDFRGYRFFQASYDQDERGTILSVNHDVAGRTITYTGYILLFTGLILTLADRNSRFRRLWNALDRKASVTAVLLIMTWSFAGEVSAQEIHISREHADRFGNLPMQSHNGRIIPVSTFASEIVRKFDIKDLIGEMTPEQFLLSITAYPSDWSLIPLIEIKDRETGSFFGWNSDRISYRDGFNAGGFYILASHIEKIYLKNPSLRSRQDKELLKIDDRLNILHELLSNRMLKIFPVPEDTLNHRWIAAGEKEISGTLPEVIRLSEAYIESVADAGVSGDWRKADSLLIQISEYRRNHSAGLEVNEEKLKAEVWYNRMNLLKICKFAYLLIGLAMIGLYLSGKRRKGQYTLLHVFLAVIFLMHTVSLGMRWYISGYAPWSNSYETMVSLSWAGILCGFIFTRRNHLVAGLATLFSGIVLLVSGLSWMDPQITPLVPVLKSPWLMAHVASLILSYGFLGICCMIGTAYLILSAFKKQEYMKTLRQMTMVNELSMQLGTGLMTVGIFLGAVWANESWGRYWSWDPKETWALITMIIYTVVLHTRWFLKSTNDKAFNLMAQLAFLSILMTFLGVNYFLSGMHSYGSHDALSNIPAWAYIAFSAFFIVPGALSYFSQDSVRKS